MSEPYDERPLSYFLKEIQRQYCRLVKCISELELRQDCERQCKREQDAKDKANVIPPFVNPWTKPPVE